MNFGYMAHTQQLMDAVNDFVALYRKGEDINDKYIQQQVFDRNISDDLSSDDIKYITAEVEKRMSTIDFAFGYNNNNNMFSYIDKCN